MSQTKSLFSKIKEFFTDTSNDPQPSLDIDSKRVDEIIKRVTEAVSNHDFELPAVLMIKPFIPTSSIISATVVTPMALILDVIGINGWEIAAFLHTKENLRRLVAKLEENKTLKEDERVRIKNELNKH